MSTAEVISLEDYRTNRGVNMDNFKKGYIALTRSIKRAEWAKCAIKRTLWENLLIDACYKNRTVNFKGIEWNLSRGQLVTTREILASQIEINGKPVTPLTIRRALEFFEKNGMISKNGNRLGTVITIVNYDIYQSYFFDQSNDQRNDQPKDQSEANNSNGSNDANDQRHDQSNDQRNDQQNNKVLEQESNNKNNMSFGNDESHDKSKIDFNLIMEAYNDAVEDKLPKIKKMTADRKNAVKKFFKENKKLTQNDLINYIYDFSEQAPKWVFGENNRAWKASLEFMLRDDTYTKFIEGAL